MIFGIGIDHIEVSRIESQITRGGSFREKIFSPGEIEYCDRHKNRAQNYAARFAAKEAFFKALGTGYRGGLAFNEIEVLNDELGKPQLRFRGKAKALIQEYKLNRIHVSLSHIKALASAVVVLECE